jgi:hypothetical protein
MGNVRSLAQQVEQEAELVQRNPLTVSTYMEVRIGEES